MAEKKYRSKKFLIYIAGYFLLWIILFEFVFPLNNILPKPSVVLISFNDLIKDYNFAKNYVSSVAVIYLSLFLSYFVIKLFSRFFFLKKESIINFIVSLNWLSNYFPAVLLGLFLIYWFPSSEYIEFLFVFITAVASLTINFQNEIVNRKKQYVDAAESMGFDDKFISNNVKWKSVQPALAEHLAKLHFYLWSVLIVFEYIKGGLGVGVVLKSALEFKDLSALFTTSAVIGVTIYLGSASIDYIKNKFFFWSID